MTTPTLIFDLDGTLSDPLKGFALSINYAFDHFGLEPVSEDDLRPHVGPPLDESIAILTETEDPDFIGELIEKYRERYIEIGFAENVLYDGIISALSELLDEGVIMGVCSTKRVDLVERVLMQHELIDCFDFVSGGDIGLTKDMQLGRLLDAGTIEGPAIMIGDRRFDLVAAALNGLPSAGVLWGYGSKEELLLESPTYLLSTPDELSTFYLSE
ncbi:MAG: HAD hydrolase-like protein [Pseudomonadota bacterium]